MHGEFDTNGIRGCEFFFGGVFCSFILAIEMPHFYINSLFRIQKNGLIHMDVSAKSGAGIDDLIHQLIDIGLKEMDEDNATTTKAKNKNSRNDSYYATLQRNDELDLHQRYGPEPRSCFPLLPFQCCCK